jgi:hypothetical protein
MTNLMGRWNDDDDLEKKKRKIRQAKGRAEDA